MRIVLASKSGVRKQILDKYKISSDVKASNVDEDQIKESLLNPGVLGDIEEPLLKIAIDQISGDAISIENNYLFKEISTPKDALKEKIILDEIIIK